MGRDKRKHFINESKLSDAKVKASVVCECGKRVPVYSHRLNKQGWTVCNWCGRRIDRTAKLVRDEKKDAFKDRLTNMMKGA